MKKWERDRGSGRYPNGVLDRGTNSGRTKSILQERRAFCGRGRIWEPCLYARVGIRHCKFLCNRFLIIIPSYPERVSTWLTSNRDKSLAPKICWISRKFRFTFFVCEALPLSIFSLCTFQFYFNASLDPLGLFSRLPRPLLSGSIPMI
jgi:hypothetical protein